MKPADQVLMFQYIDDLIELAHETKAPLSYVRAKTIEIRLKIEDLMDRHAAAFDSLEADYKDLERHFKTVLGDRNV